MMFKSYPSCPSTTESLRQTLLKFGVDPVNRNVTDAEREMADKFDVKKELAKAIDARKNTGI